MTNTVTQPIEEEVIVLSPEEQLFCSLVAKGYTGTSAYKKAYAKAESLTPLTIRRYASDLLTKTHISSEVATKQERLSRMARLADDRIEEILVEGDINSKENNVSGVAMFMHEQANGKATQKLQIESKHVSVNYNLSGTLEPVPQDILDELEDD